MTSDLTHASTPTTLDLTGLPQPVVEQVTRLVREAREKQAAVATPPRRSVIGMFAHLGVQTPSLDEFQEARREAWTNFPREFPDPPK